MDIYVYETYRKASYMHPSPTKKSLTAYTKLPMLHGKASTYRKRGVVISLQIMKCIRNEEQRETAFADPSLLRFLKSLCILSLVFFKLPQNRDSNIDHSKLCLKLLCLHRFSLHLAS